MNFTKGKEFLGPINLDNIHIIHDWVVEKENFLDKDDFDMDLKAIENSWLLFQKLLIMKK